MAARGSKKTRTSVRTNTLFGYLQPLGNVSKAICRNIIDGIVDCLLFGAKDIKKKKGWNEEVRRLTLNDICQTVEVLRIDETMKVAPVHQMRRDMLKKDVQHVLSKRPDGINVSELWNVVTRETGRVVNKHNYNVTKVSDLLDLWKDEFRISDNRIYLREGAGFSTGANYDGNFPLPGVSGLSEVSRQPGRGAQVDKVNSVSSESDSDSDDVSILETANSKMEQRYTTGHQREVDERFKNVTLKESSKVKNQTAMSVMSSLSTWGKPAKPGTSGMSAKTGPSNLNSQQGNKSELPSFDFISLVDDNGKGRKKSSPIDTVDLTDDTPVRPTNKSSGSFGPPVLPMQGLMLQQQPGFMFNRSLPPAVGIMPLMGLQTPLMLNTNVRNQPGTSAQMFHVTNQSAGPLLMSPGSVSMNNNNANVSQGPAMRTDIVDLTLKHIERKEFETKEIVIHPVNISRSRQPPREFVDTIAKECIETLADADEFVMPERVEKLVCQRFQINNLRQIGFNHVTQIPCVNELNRLLNKIHAYILGFIKTRPICTLYELREAMREYVPNKEDFSKLKVGPLQRSPVVWQQFKFPPDQAEIPEITSIDVLEHFRNFMTKKNLWTARLTLEPFMDYMVEEYNTENAYYLGVRVMSLPLAAAVLKKAQRDAAANRREAYDHYKQQLKEEIEDAFRKFRAIMLQTGDEEGMEVRKHFLKMRPDLVIMEVFEKFNLLMTVTQMGEMTRGHQKKLSKVISDFVSTMRNDELGKSLFHLAICMSSTAIEEATLALLMPKEESEKSSNVQGSMGEVSKPPPRKDNLIESVRNYIERCLNAGSLSLNHLDRIEEKLLEEFGFADFHLMGYGRFLQFLITESKTKQALEEGGGLVLGSSSTWDKDAMFKPHQTDIQEFIKQCKLCGLNQPEEIETALCKHYSVKEARYLGYGNIARLLSQADKHRPGTYSDFTVFYQSTLTKPTGLPHGAGQKVGVLGHQNRDLAKICLHNCPLLEDLAAWSQWGLVFEPELGKLKDFVHKYGGVTNKTLEGGRLATLDFLALETKPGVLLKIVSNTSAELVEAALEKRDVYNFCGHLVSMVIAYKGVNNLPKALLSGHIKTALLQLHAADPRTDTPGAPSTFISQNSASQFVLQCLLRIPTSICVDLADDLFLSPLGQVVGSTKFKQLLVQLCSSVYELNHLAELGCLLGIQEWTNSISQKCIVSESSIQSITPEVEELFKEEPQVQDMDEDEDSSSESETEDLEEILVGETKVEMKSDPDTATGTCKEENDVNDVEIIDISQKESDSEDDDVKIVEEPDVVRLIDDDVIIEDGSVEIKTRTCEDIVNEIRKEEFGVGVQLSEDAQRLMKVQQHRLGRSLDRLSKDLYSKDTHFVLELVQNADDNSYHDDLLNNTNDVCPSVKFVIDEESVSVRNNELGFQEKNIRALCDVGRSTKGKHKFGYIGQKGIGFKSVYRVTDCPEIHSNGYHVKFDVKSGPMGYILPHWSTKSDRLDESWTTNIILTLKQDMRLHTRTLAARFNDIHPSLLLFLHRLREITIENKVENSVQTMRRRDVGENIIEIKHTEGLDRWLVIKKMLDASQISSHAKSGADVESTEIALAFPLKPSEQKLNMHRLPPKQLVFAFLPLRSYGFRFIVQGDFDVPSSREDVDRDSSWNQWLRNEIHTLFLDSLDMFKSHEEFNNIEAVTSFLQFVPMEDEVLDFFKPVASDILKKLKARPCVPTQPNSQGAISWKIPSQTVRVRDPLVRSVITADLLQKHLNLHYLHPDVASMLNPTLTSCLGIETLTTDHLFHLGKALIVKMGEHVTTENVLLIARWLACMYRSLDEFQEDDGILSTLKSLTMLPLSDGKLVSLQEETVFYPIANLDASVQRGKDPLYYLQQDVNSLHPLLLKTDDEEVNSQVHKLLLRLGIKQLSPFDVINHHIIPVLKSETWNKKCTATLVSYIIYVKEQTEKQSNVCNLEELKDIARIVTNKGIKNPNTEPVHFSHNYGNTINLQKTFPGYDWTVVDPVYLPTQCTHSVLLSWHDFFVKLGVEDLFSVQKRAVCLKKEQLGTSHWKNECDFWPQGETEYYIQDYYCEELEDLVTNNQYPSGEVYENQMRALCLCLEKSWDNQFSRYTKTNVCDKNGRNLKETDTSFSILLRDSCWLPAVVCKCVGEPDGRVSQSKTIEMRKPACLYIQSEKLRRLVSDKVPYLDVKLSLNSSFHQFLDLKNIVTIETIKEYLLQWCFRSDSSVPSVFCTSLGHMKQVYIYLSTQLNRGDLQTLLLENPVFFVPSNLTNPDEVVSGKMLNRSEIWLADKTGLFDKHRGLLEEFHSEICKKRTICSYYGDIPELINMFKQDGRIDQQPKVEEYIELLSLLCNSSSPKDLAVLTDVLYIFTTIGLILSQLPEAPDEKTAEMILDSIKATVKKKMQKEKVLPTKKGIWVSLNDKPLIADNRDWEKMFVDKEKVHFLDLEDKQILSKQRRMAKSGRLRGKATDGHIQADMIQEFIEICEVKKLSDCVKMEVTPDLIQPCTKLQSYFHQIVPIMQQFLLAKYEDVYRDLEQRNTKQMLKDANFYQTGKLEVIYRLNILDKETFDVREEKCVINPPTFFFHQDHVQTISEVNREIARHFSGGNSECNNALRMFLSELYTTLSHPENGETAEMLLQQHDVDADIADIPDDEIWQVTPPALPEPEPEPEPLEEFPLEASSGHKQSRNKDEPFVLRAWPPVKSEDSSTPKEKSDLPTSNIWPPPKAKDYMRSVRDLPSNIRMAGPGEENTTTTNQEEIKDNDDTQPKSSKGEINQSGPRGEGQSGSHGNSENVSGVGTVSDVKRKRKLSEAVDDDQNIKRHSSEFNGSSESMEERSAEGQTDQSHSNAESRENRPAQQGEHSYRQTRSPVKQTQPSEMGQSNIKGVPVWSHMASEYTFDELGSGQELPNTLTLLENTTGDPEIGRWGENLVACYLQRQKEAGNIIDFKWNNHESEKGAPYDFLVHFADENGIKEDFIEVKSTVSEDKEVFEISVQQIKFAEEKKGNFHIYRVFNAGDPEKVRLIRIFDLDLRLSQKQVKLCMLI